VRSLSGPAVAALSQPSVPLVQLVWLGFSPPVALNTSNWDLTFSGVIYKGAYGIGSVSEIEDSPGEIKGLQFTLSGVGSANVALALDDAAVVQGTPVVIRTAVLDGSTYQIVDAPIEWSGTLDTMSIVEDGETCAIQVTAESSAVDLLRGAALTYSNADQQAQTPGDRAFEYVISQSSSPFVWPTRDWFIKFGKR
jgi:hypothetical protein